MLPSLSGGSTVNCDVGIHLVYVGNWDIYFDPS